MEANWVTKDALILKMDYKHFCTYSLIAAGAPLTYAKRAGFIMPLELIF